MSKASADMRIRLQGRDLLIGADPELFLKHPKSKMFVSAHDLLPGSKEVPHKVPFGAVQVDGTAAEFNITPAKSAKEFSDNIHSVINSMAQIVPGYNLVVEPTAIFNKDYFDTCIPDSAKRLGCDPDFNAWTFLENPRPDPQDAPFRTGAGHIHIGWTEGQDIYDPTHFSDCVAVARQMDYYLGVWSLLWDKDPTRRQLYGKAGAFRPKSYGCEYRVMSNAWLRSNILINWVYEAAIAGMDALRSNGEAQMFHGDIAELIINNNETDWLTKYDLSDIGVPPLPNHYLRAG